MITIEEARQAVLDAMADGYHNPEGYMEWFESQTDSEKIKIGSAILFGVEPKQLNNNF